MAFSRRHFLQWNPYSNEPKQKDFLQAFIKMWFAPFFAAVAFIYLSFYAPISLVFVLPLLVLWGVSPFLVWFISRPAQYKQTDISKTQTAYLRKLSRKIWAFFEVFVTAEDNWLPPDNYQEHPVERTAHRTSPTNIGMSLLSSLTAYDLLSLCRETIGFYHHGYTNL